MTEDIFREMAQKVIKKLDDKIKSSSYHRNLQVETDTYKIQGLIDNEKHNDLYIQWLREEFYAVNKVGDIYRIHLMSAISAYLAFLDEFPFPEELQKYKPFEIFYNIYKNALNIKQATPKIELR